MTQKPNYSQVNPFNDEKKDPFSKLDLKNLARLFSTQLKKK